MTSISVEADVITLDIVELKLGKLMVA